MNQLEQTRATEGKDAHQRFVKISLIIKDGLRQTPFVENTPWDRHSYDTAKELLVQVAPHVDPKIRTELYWPHLLLSSIYGGKLAAVVKDPDLEYYEAIALMLWHDAGRLILANRYRMNDLIDMRLLQRANVKKEVLQKYPPFEDILGVGEHKIEKLEDLTFGQRIMDLADNIGKLDPTDKTLVNLETMTTYTLAQPDRYPEGPWPPENLGREVLVKEGRQKFATGLVLAEANWLVNNYGVNMAMLRGEVDNRLVAN